MYRDKKFIQQFFFWLFIGLVIFFLGKAFLADIGDLKNYQFHFEYRWIILACLVYFLAYILLSCSFYFILRQMKYKISFGDNLAYTIYSQFGTYVPGKIWVYIIRYKLLKKYQVSKHDFLTVFAIDTILIFSSASLISLFFVSNFYPANGLLIKTLFIFLLFLALVGLHPKIFYPLANWLLKKIKRPLVDKTKQISYGKLVWLFVLNLIYWLLLGTAFYFFSKSLIEIHADRFFDVVGIYVLAVWLGFIVVFIPHGFGVRESVKAAGLSTFLPFSVAVLLALLSRLWSLANELLWSLVLSIITKQKPVFKKNLNYKIY